MVRRINVGYLSVEAVPFVKVGGLADVSGSLPNSIVTLAKESPDKLEIDLRIILPLHSFGNLNNVSLDKVTSFNLSVSHIDEEVTAYKGIMNGVFTYFLDWSSLSDSDQVYSSMQEVEQKKFIFFSIAAINFIKILNWKLDILHANDWHTALCMQLIKSTEFKDFFINTKGILSIHNLPYMGGDCRNILTENGIPIVEDSNIPDLLKTQPLTIGLVNADLIIPVSATYASEIQTPEFGHGLQDYLKKNQNKIKGITNGIDTNYWNPNEDLLIQTTFNAENLTKRTRNKKVLQDLFNLSNQDEIPIISMISRINYQKGIDVALNALDLIDDIEWHLIILGTGDPELESEIRLIMTKKPGQVVFINSYDEPIAHKIYAGADIFLMPSRYEPCGLSQMIANRYGCVPVVTNVGGLKDTISNKLNGFVAKNCDINSVTESLYNALKIFKERSAWHQIQYNGMKKDFSWKKAAGKYLEVYDSISKTRGDL